MLTGLRAAFKPTRATPLAILAAFAIVSMMALVAKVIIEGATTLSYEIHWTTTVPPLVLALALVLNARMNVRAQPPSSAQ